ncbi:IPT/TIG domain-containing protein [uncultured Pontibacter sp.]|uniref:DUF7619 domain-containing protein n=1 Tax=uncultured Pontibacter sp. TaxID=453356 RepID=UPI00260292E6|nr:IPT/TIG domain-containing protein [uncultured Pontibacter sp.]
MIGPTLTTPVGVVLDEEGNLYVANSYQVRVLEANGDFKKDITFEDAPAPGKARAIAKDQNGNIYIWDSLTRYLYKSDKEGNFLFKFRNTYTNTYHGTAVEGIAVAPDGSIYITDVYQHVVRKFSNDGQFIHELNGLKTPIDVAVGSDGSVFVADSHHSRIVKFSAAGQLVTSYANPGNATQGFNMPTGIEVDEKGILYVADAGTRMVHAFHESGEHRMSVMLQSIGQGINMGVGLDATGNIYVSGSGSLTFTPMGGKIIKLSPQGEILAEYGSQLAATDRLVLTALETDSAGHYFYAGDWLTRKVHVFNRQGIKLREFGTNGPDSEFNAIQDIASGTDGSVYVLDSLREGRVRRYSAIGSFISEFDAIPDQEIRSQPRHKLTLGLDQNFYVLGTGKVVKYNKLGKLLSVIQLSDTIAFSSIPTYKDIAVDAAGNLYVIIHENRYDAGLNAVYHVNKYAASGEIITKFVTRGRTMGGENIPKSIEIDKQGNIYIAGTSVDIFNTAGALTGHVPVLGDEVSVSADGHNMLVGNTHREHVYILSKSSDSDDSNSYISGTIYHDANSDGQFGSNESRLKDILVRVEPGSVFGKSDASGNYKIAVDATGTYEVSQVIPKIQGIEITQTSPEANQPHSVTISKGKTTVLGLNFGNQVTLSPRLSVSVSSTRRRRCFESTTTVRYNNSGFAAAPDAKVYLQLPKEVELLSADKPYTLLPDGTYEFAVGDLAAGQSGVIMIEDKVTCGDESVRNRTVCTRAWITPSNNKPVTRVATVTITGQCNYDLGMVRFVIKNTGTANMETAELFRKYIDGDLASIEQYRLAAGDSIVLWVPTSGMTVRLEADQPDGNGDNTKASVTVEACRTSATQSGFSTGFVSTLPTDDEEAEVSEECMLITDSYDPNDKLVTPVGRTSENYTPTNTALKYKIRFQNTGTDVAYRVVVVDTLSEHLDLSTLQVGATSHPSRFEVSGKGQPVLTWTFDNIMLPDSTADEPGSHGYIQFSIKPKADLPEKTSVENFADIFFDFNSPIRTNVTINRIYDMPPVINEAVRINLEEVLATPSITEFSPAAGRYGSEITITGKRFSAVAADNKVYLNGKVATVVTASPTELRVLVPANSSTGELKVITPDGGVTASEMFEVYHPPIFSDFSPVEGKIGTTVTITGEHLQTNLIEDVKLNGLDCEVLSAIATSLTVRVPTGAETGSFELRTKGGEVMSATPFVVWHQPIINSLSSENAIVGATIHLNGAHFANDKTRNKVKFGQTLATVLEATQHQLTVKVPEGAESGQISLETPGGMAWSATTFEVIPGPKFTAMQPAKGTVGTVVELTGEHFGVQGHQDVIRFNGEQALVLETSENRYKVRVPRGAQTGKVTISGYGGVAQSTADFVVEELAPAEAIQVYPNPNNGQFTVNLRHADFDVQLIEVYDAVGKRHHQTHITGPRPETVEINLPSAKSGLYFLQIQTERGLITKKLTVM